MKGVQYLFCLQVLGIGLVGCDRAEKDAEPATPQEMYARVRELIKPNAEHEASDPAEALKWLRMAAEGGLMQAQTDLGGLYYEGGRGVKQDGKEALKWFTMAADQGSKEALVYMGLIHALGVDVPRDRVKACAFWRKAAEAGVQEAQFYLGAYGEDAKERVQWLVKAVQGNNPTVAAQAASALGFLYARGADGVQVDMKEAVRWYELAARGGDAGAQLVYGIMLLQGEQVAKDGEQGMKWIRMSAGQDDPRAMALLINLLRNGADAERNEQEAAAWSERLEKLRKKTSVSSAPQKSVTH